MLNRYLSFLLAILFCGPQLAFCAQTINGAWVNSENLQINDKLVSDDNKVYTVVEPWQQRINTTTTYNMEVDNLHTYFIGKQKIWTHNNGNCSELEAVTIDYTRQLSETEQILADYTGHISDHRILTHRRVTTDQWGGKSYEYDIYLSNHTHADEVIRRIRYMHIESEAWDFHRAVSKVKIKLYSNNRGGLAEAENEIMSVNARWRPIGEANHTTAKLTESVGATQTNILEVLITNPFY